MRQKLATTTVPSQMLSVGFVLSASSRPILRCSPSDVMLDPGSGHRHPRASRWYQPPDASIRRLVLSSADEDRPHRAKRRRTGPSGRPHAGRRYAMAHRRVSAVLGSAARPAPAHRAPRRSRRRGDRLVLKPTAKAAVSGVRSNSTVPPERPASLARTTTVAPRPSPMRPPTIPITPASATSRG